MATGSQFPGSGYQVTRQIPSVFLDKGTVSLIEAFLLEHGSQLDPPRSRREALFLSILDSAGGDRLSSIKDYPFPSFDDGILSLFISYGVFGETLSMSVNFGRTAEESHVSVNYLGPGGRHVTERLADGLIALLDEVKTSNSLFHPGPALRGALTALFLAAIGVQFSFFLIYRRFFDFLVPLILVIYTYLYLAPMFNPYTTFETARRKEPRLWSVWLIGAALALLSLWFAGSLLGLLVP